MNWGNTLLIMGLAFGMIACSGQQKEKEEGISGSVVSNPQSAEGQNEKVADIEFQKKKYDFGTVKQGEKVEKYYVFENTGQQDLLITNAAASCGCTVPSKPEEPIPPGQKDSIKVVFDSEGRSGQQTKTITIHTNTLPKQHKLKLVGKVEKKD